MWFMIVTMANDMNLEQLVPHGKPTMCAHNGKDSSVIDLLFASDKTKCSQVKVGDKVPWNTSCHNPITFNLLYKKPTKSWGCKMSRIECSNWIVFTSIGVGAK